MASKFAFRVLLMLSFSGAPILARPAACTDLVECEHEGNSTLHGATHSPPKPLLPNHCPGKPECSGHGQCQRPNPPTTEPTCRCAQGFFGRDCSRQQRDCTKLRSCTDCNHAANGKFCGWCADSRYCVPKHVHKMLAPGAIAAMFPDLTGLTPRLAGLGWFQGWNVRGRCPRCASLRARARAHARALAAHVF